MSTPQLHLLKVARIEHLTNDAMAISFDVPLALRPAYRFTQGQFISFEADIAGQTLRRSYSLCVSPAQYELTGQLRVGIKAVAQGVFSQWIHNTLREGDALKVLTPDGRFYSGLNTVDDAQKLCLFAGGSGITPILSIIRAVLAMQAHSTCTLVYGNRRMADMMFLEELAGLKNQYLTRLHLISVLSDEPQDIPLFHGQLDQERCLQLLSTVIPHQQFDEFFVCGPAPMMEATEQALHTLGVAKEKIHIERFGVQRPKATVSRPVSGDSLTSKQEWIEIVVDGATRQVPLQAGQSVLDAGLAAGLPLPYACKAGVCCTCRAKVLRGTVHMDANFTLQEAEMAQGFVLTCQSHPSSAAVCVSYDER
ncbi:MAG: hypothetical protein RLZZ502_1327 [Pseudomonadota bacterium]|jgi:ring-1,2-phenylacetyl-CoA epoxidase subunit PaaE